MKIRRCKTSVTSTDTDVLARIERELPDTWFGYTLLPRDEIDLVVVTHERVLLLDLKDWHGVVTTKGDIWFLNGVQRGRSPAFRLREVAKEIVGRMAQRLEARRQPAPYVDCRVVFTAKCDTSSLPAGEALWTIPLERFVELGDPEKYNEAFSPNLMGVSPTGLRGEFDASFCGRDSSKEW